MERFMYNGKEGHSLEASKYRNGNYKLAVVDPEDKTLKDVITMDYEYRLKEDLIAVDNWRKCEDTVQLLRGLGIIDEFITSRFNGYSSLPIYRLTDKGMKLFS